MKTALLAVCVALCLLPALGQDGFEPQTYVVRDPSGGPCATYTLAGKFLPFYTRNGSTERIAQEVYLPSLNETEYEVSIINSKCPEVGFAELVVDFSDQQRFTLSVQSSDTTSPGAKVNANWTVTSITFRYNVADPKIFPDTTDSGLNTAFVNNPPIGTNNNQGGLYKCSSPEFISLNSTDNQQVDMELRDVLLNPFQEDPDQGGQVECAADSKKSSSDDKIVPIAVGCALGGLLLIVIIAFLVGRRSRRTGYKQV